MRNQIHVLIDLEAARGKVSLLQGTSHRDVFVESESAEWTSLLVAVLRILQLEEARRRIRETPG
jgi:hypothetical protein